MGRQRPVAVTRAVQVQWLLVVVSGLGTLLTALMRDDLLRAWAAADPEAAQILADGGLRALEESSLALPSFVPVAVVSYVIYAALVWVLTVLFREGHRWTRYALVCLAADFLFAMLVLFRADPPAAFVVLGALAVLLDLVLLWFLLDRETGEWIRGVELAQARQHGS